MKAQFMGFSWLRGFSTRLLPLGRGGSAPSEAQMWEIQIATTKALFEIVQNMNTFRKDYSNGS
jgi:hypothetical protein